MASFVFQGFSVIVCVCVCDGVSGVWPQMIMLGEQSTGGGNGLPLTNMDVCSVLDSALKKIKISCTLFYNVFQAVPLSTL